MPPLPVDYPFPGEVTPDARVIVDVRHHEAGAAGRINGESETP